MSMKKKNDEEVTSVTAAIDNHRIKYVKLFFLEDKLFSSSFRTTKLCLVRIFMLYIYIYISNMSVLDAVEVMSLDGVVRFMHDLKIMKFICVDRKL